MGRATIVSGGTEGRYVIEMDYGLAARSAKVAKLNALLLELEDRRIFQQDQVDGFQGGLDSFGPEMDVLINAYIVLLNAVPQNETALGIMRKQVDDKTAQIIKQQLWLGDAKNNLSVTDAQITAATAARAALESAEITEQRAAWCADLTETAAGAVATLEIPGESGLILIAPQAPAPATTDGALSAREIQSPAQVYWNAAVLPGWQKYKPTYRWGTITELDENADTASVALAPALSSAQRLDVNQAETLTGVPVVYMACHASAFVVGDRVVVGFTGQDWAHPHVIGFVDHPRACGGPALYCIPATSTAIYGWSPPTTDALGSPINAGKGSVAVKGNPAGATQTEKDGTNRTAGVLAGVATPGVNGLATRLLRGVRADVAGLPTTGPTEEGNWPNPEIFSSVGRTAYEWISKTGRYVATAVGTCRVNGQNIGLPAAGTPCRVFVPAPALTGSVVTAFCLAEQFGTRFHLYRRPLLGGPAVAWQLVTTINLTGVSVAPTLDVYTLQSIVNNDDASVVTLWFSTGQWGIGCLDVVIPSGTITWVPAVSTFSKNYSIVSADLINPRVDTFSTPIAVDYVGNEKAFATLTGTRTVSRVFTTGAESVPGDSWSSPTTDVRTTREIVSANFWGVEVQIADFLWEYSGSSTPVVELSLDGVPYLSDVINHYAIYATLSSRAVYHFHRKGDPVFFSFKDYARTKISDANFRDFYDAGEQTIPAMQYGTGFLHAGNDHELTRFSRPAYTRTSTTVGSTVTETLPPEADGSESKFYATLLDGEYWQETLNQSTGEGYWTPAGYPGNGLGHDTISDVLRSFKCLFYPETRASFRLGAGYATGVTNYADAVNVRAFGGFAIFSHPSTIEGNEGFRTTIRPNEKWPPNAYKYPPDSSLDMDFVNWHTYCSDPAALARYALDLALVPPAPARLKHLQITSST